MGCLHIIYEPERVGSTKTTCTENKEKQAKNGQLNYESRFKFSGVLITLLLVFYFAIINIHIMITFSCYYYNQHMYDLKVLFALVFIHGK